MIDNAAFLFTHLAIILALLRISTPSIKNSDIALIFIYLGIIIALLRILSPVVSGNYND